MKILLLNFTDSGGGAAIAAVRLTKSLNESGIDATLGVVEKKTNQPFVWQMPQVKKNRFTKLIQRIGHIFVRLLSPVTRIFPRFTTTNNIFHSTNLKSIIDVNFINNSDFDIVHLHWINSDMISIKDIAKINKPIVWTMHDSWPACGAEHHPNILENDTRYITGYLKSNKPKTTHGKDICRKVWEQKLKYLKNKNITFIAPSAWEKNVLKDSYLFRNKKCFCIPNIIDHDIFCSKDKNQIRKMFSIPENKKIIGFGAAYDIDNPKSMKGSFYLIDALKTLKNSSDYFLVIFGPAGSDFTKHLTIPFFATGYIANPVILSLVYNACDIFVNPSLIETLSYTGLESICCGVPVVAFNVGGILDIVEHKKTGYLSSPYKSTELVEGIEYCFENQNVLSKNCILKAKSDFNTQKTIQAHIDVYKDVIGTNAK